MMPRHSTVISSMLGTRACSTSGYGTKNFAADLQRLLDVGYAIGHAGTVAGRGPFVYLLTESHPGTVVELLDMSGERERIFARIAEAARNWEGKEPIRTALPRD